MLASTINPRSDQHRKPLPSRLGFPFWESFYYVRIVGIQQSKSSKRLRRKVISLVRGKSWEGRSGIKDDVERIRFQTCLPFFFLDLSTYVKPLRAKEADSGQGN